MNPALILAAVFLLHLAVEPVTSIKCYQCSSAVDKDCSSGDKTTLQKFEGECQGVALPPPFSAVTLSPDVFTRCFKDIGKDGDVDRSCAFPIPGFDDNCVDKDDGSKSCMCKGDLCNTALAQRMNVMGLTALLAVSTPFFF